MCMDFIGRRQEMEFLEEQYRMPHPLVFIKGRRRVGKSRLIEEFIKDKESLYFEVDKETSESILQSLSDAVSESAGIQGLRFTNWKDALKTYVSNRPGRKIIVIDEFPYAVRADRDLLKTIQGLWDTYLSKENVMLILCGSSLVSMKSYSEEDSPLHGRGTGDLTLMPLPFRDTMGGKPYRTAVEEYSITGGVPYYMMLMRDGLTPKENAVSSSLSLGAPLLNEGEYLLGSEFSNLSSYNTYMRAIANGNRTAEKLTGAVQAPSSEVLPYIRRLMDVGMVERISPITEKSPEHSRNGQYVIADSFMQFWFRFVYPYRSNILKEEPETALDDLEEHFVDAHVAFVFEGICRKELRSYLLEKGVHARYGKYWGNGEIDLIALDNRNKTAYVCECKFTERPLGLSVLNSLVSKAGDVKELGDYRKVYCIFSVSGYNDDIRDGFEGRDVILFNNGVPI